MQNHGIKYLLCCILLLASCEKALIEKDGDSSNRENFDLLWNIIDRNYSFFLYKEIDWDSIYGAYSPRINENLNKRELFSVFSDMLNELRDGHVNLYTGFDQSRYDGWFTSYPENFNYAVLHGRYLRNNYTRTGNFMTVIIDSTGYIYSQSFAEKVKESDLDEIVRQFNGLKGVIFDVRHNSGGYSSNVGLIASRFADTKRLASYTLYKNGPGHGDFTEPQPNYIAPGGREQFTGKLVILTNRRTYSATNDFVLSMSALPNVVIMGDTTGGGGGTPYDYELLNGWRLRFPRTQTLTPDGFNIEHGIPPDIPVRLRRFDQQRGVDTIVEAALNLIKDNK
jgi:hypothetical protein